MSRRRTAALAALVLVVAALVVVVLLSVAGSDDDEPSKAPGQAQTQPAPAPSGGQPSHQDGSSGSGGRTLGRSGGAALPLLDKGSAPKSVNDKLGPAASDGTISLGELRGSPMVLNVWSSDCTPCRAEAPLLESEWQRLGRRGIVFLGLNVADAPGAAKQFRKDYDITYPSLEEKKATTARALGATGVPETLFISKKGDVVGQVQGGINLGQLEVGIRAAQSGAELGTQQGGGQTPLP